MLSDAGKLDLIFLVFVIIFIYLGFLDSDKNKPKQEEAEVCIETRLTLNKNEVHVFCGKKVSLDTN